MFGLGDETRLLGVYPCAVRREVNAVKEVREYRGGSGCWGCTPVPGGGK
jgi:hypothetical protein